jgi:hypothetical protein
VNELGPLTWAVALICDPFVPSGRRDSNPRPLVVNHGLEGPFIVCQELALTRQKADRARLAPVVVCQDLAGFSGGKRGLVKFESGLHQPRLP